MRRWIVSCCVLLSSVMSAHAQRFVVGDRVQTGHYNYCADAGSTDAYACNLLEAITAYGTGTHYTFKANTINTGAATLNLNSLGAKTIKKTVGGVTTDLADGDICAGQLVSVIYDGTNMQMLSQLCNAELQSFTILVGSDDAASALTDAQLGPQLHLYTFTRPVTIQQISVYADAGTPSVIVHRRTGTTNTPLLSSALATAASGALACAKTSAVAGIEGTTCSATLQNNTVSAGHTIGLTSGTAGGTAKRLSVIVMYTYN